MVNQDTRSLVKSIPKRESRMERSVDDLVINFDHEMLNNSKLHKLLHFGSFYLEKNLKVFANVELKGREEIINCSLSVMGNS